MSSHKTDGSGKPCEYGHEPLPHAVVFNYRMSVRFVSFSHFMLNLPDSLFKETNRRYLVYYCFYFFMLSIFSNILSNLSTMRCCSARGGRGNTETATLSVFRFLTTAPATFDPNTFFAYGDNNK